MAGARQFPIALKLRKAITIKKTTLTRFRRLVALDLGDLLRADPEARWASLAAGAARWRAVAQRRTAGGGLAGVD